RLKNGAVSRSITRYYVSDRRRNSRSQNPAEWIVMAGGHRAGLSPSRCVVAKGRGIREVAALGLDHDKLKLITEESSLCVSMRSRNAVISHRSAISICVAPRE